MFPPVVKLDQEETIFAAPLKRSVTDTAIRYTYSWFSLGFLLYSYIGSVKDEQFRTERTIQYRKGYFNSGYFV